MRFGESVTQRYEQIKNEETGKATEDELADERKRLKELATKAAREMCSRENKEACESCQG